MTPAAILLAEFLDWLPTLLTVWVIGWFVYLWKARG